MLMTKRTHRKRTNAILTFWRTKADRLEAQLTREFSEMHRLENENRDLRIKVIQWERVHGKIENATFDANARYDSPDGKKVLKALQDALNLCRDYQKHLWTLCAADPEHLRTTVLLAEWGMAPYDKISNQYAAPLEKREDRVEADMRKYGDESFGTDRVVLKAERTEDGDRVWFENVDKKADYEGEAVDIAWEDYPGTSQQPALPSGSDD